MIDIALKLLTWFAGLEWREDCTRWELTVRIVNWLMRLATLFALLLALYLARLFGIWELLGLTAYLGSMPRNPLC